MKLTATLNTGTVMEKEEIASLCKVTIKVTVGKVGNVAIPQTAFLGYNEIH
jgi:cephalosporin-C deacetylase-like acetyl esterase